MSIVMRRLGYRVQGQREWRRLYGARFVRAPTVHGRAVLLLLLFTVPALSGCFGIYVANVPDQHLTDGWTQTDSGGGERWRGLVAEWAHVTYQVDPPASGPFDDGPYPASLTIMSVESASRMRRDDVLERLDAQVRDNAGAQGIVLDDSSKRQGERTLASGVRSVYFTYVAEIGAGGTFFAPGRDARVIGEVWFDEREKITVLAVGLAQTQGGGSAGQYFSDQAHWVRMVSDPSGSIDGHTAGNGLIYNVRSHE